jgi:hypothetical protein
MTLTARRPSKVKEQLLDDMRDADEPKKRLNVEIEVSLYRRMKARAVAEDRTISAITRQFWLEYLSTTSSE